MRELKGSGLTSAPVLRSIPARPSDRLNFLARLMPVLIAVVAATLVISTPVGNAAAATGSTAGDRVKAIEAETFNAVEADENIGAGQRQKTVASRLRLAQGRGVHTYYVIPSGVDGATTGRAVLVHNAGGACPRPMSVPNDENWGSANSLARHFRDHGADFGATSADDYASQASQFFQRGLQGGLPTKVDADGVIRVYDPSTNTFGAFNPSGTTRTFFKPTSPGYWSRQPGTAP